MLYALIKVGVRVPRAVLWAWNLWGSWCLVVILAVAVTTSPVVRLFGDDPRNLNTWVLFFPYVWLPVVLVTVAIAGHVMVTRALLRRGETAREGAATGRGPRR
jgi:Na+-driven multidrug efflux pump